MASEIQAARQGAYDQFHGWTFEGAVQGMFRMPDGTAKGDACHKYMVFLEESRINELEGILREFKVKTLQQVIYLEIQRHVAIRLL